MRKAAILLLAVFLIQNLHAVDLPKPPSGFSWREIPELKAAFLKPDGWYFKREDQKGTLAYFITKENIDQNHGQFDTGLTVNVFHLKKDPAVEKGKALIASMALQHQVEMWTHEVGPFREFGCELKDTDATGTIMMHALTVANPKTNTLYLFVFESPESKWDDSWKIGKQIMDTLAIDDEM